MLVSGQLNQLSLLLLYNLRVRYVSRRMPPITPILPTESPGSLSLTLTRFLPSQVFSLTTHTVLRFGSLVSERATQLRVRKTLRQALPTGGFLFDVQTLSRLQTPAQGSERLTAELAPVLEKLEIETDPTGRLVRVANKAHLRQRWATLLPQLQATYRADPDVSPALLAQLGQVLAEGDTLETTLAHSPEYSLLFSPLYDHTYSADVPTLGVTELERFVGELTLPFRTETLLDSTAPADAPTLRVAGEVEAARYPAAAVRQALCTLTDQPNLDTRVVAFHQATYTFGAHHELRAATRHTRADIPGVLSQQLTVVLQASTTS